MNEFTPASNFSFNPQLFTIIAISLTLPLFITLLQLYLQKSKTKQYGIEELRRLKEEEFPKSYKNHYDNLTVGLLILSIIFLLSTGFVSWFLYPKLQRVLMAPEAIFFSGSYTSLLIMFLNWIGIGFSFIGFITYLVFLIARKDFKRYLILRSAKEGFVFDEADMFRKLLKLSLFFYILAAPLIILCLHDYKAVFNDRIVANKFLDLRTYNYSYEDVKNVEYKQVKKKDVITFLIFNFKDGRSVDFTPAFTTPSDVDNDRKNLYNELLRKKINTSGFPDKYTK